MHIKQLIKKQNETQQKVSDFYTPNGLHIYFKDPMENDNVDVEKVIAKVESILPHHLTSEVEMIIVGKFKEFEEKGFNAFYDSGTICVDSEQDDNEDMIDDLIHEFAHSLEEPHGMLIYGDSKIQQEFLGKRYALHDILWKSGIKIPKSIFSNLEYDTEFDLLLYKKIGYDKLRAYCEGLFLTAYAPTSLREYFATGFTEFFLYPDSHDHIKKTCPVLYKKIYQLYYEESVDNYQ